MARSRWKLKHFSNSMWRKITYFNLNAALRRRKVLYDRSSHIPECLTFINVKIHKGMRYRNLFIDQYMIGKKFGEFSFTRKPFHYPLKKSKKKNLINRR